MLALLLACDPADTGKDPADSAAPTANFSDVVITPSAYVPTVLDVTFTTDSEDAGWVRFGPDGEEGWTASATSQGGGAWSARLVGLPAGTASWVTVGAGAAEGPTTTLTTEEPPAWVDHLETSDGSPTPGFLAVGLSSAEGSGGVILDTKGRPVWWYETPEGIRPTIHTRARIAPDLQSVWFNVFNVGPAGGNGDGEAVLVEVAIDGSTSEVLSVPYNHHDFLLLEDGTVAWIDVDEQEFDGEVVRGDVIRERAPDGTETTVWSAWDFFDFDPDAPHEETWWTLANHLEYDPATDAYTIGSRNLGTIVHVDRPTGDVLWSVGGVGTTYVVDDPFVMQHGFDVVDGGILVFDNGPFNEVDSRAARYSFDGSSATLTWEYRADPALYSFVMGDVHALADGGVRVVFSTEADVREVSAAGEVLSHFTWTEGTVIGFAEYRESLVE